MRWPSFFCSMSVYYHMVKKMATEVNYGTNAALIGRLG